MSSNPGTFGIPPRELALAEGKTAKGESITVKLAEQWYRLLIRLAQLTAERPIAPVALDPSPAAFTATTIGHLLVRGGTVSGVTLTRGADSVVCPSSGFIPMAAEDVVEITYSVLPTVTFVPGARA